MTQFRIQVQGVRAGSSARRAEQEASEATFTGTARSRQIRAGSSARLAEEAKRENRDLNQSRSVGFSMRARNGQVSGGSPPNSAKPVHSDVPTLSEGPVDPVSEQTGDSVRVTPWAASFQSAGSRLTSMIRGLFDHKKPSNPKNL